MKNKNLMLDLIELNGVDAQIDMIIEKCLLLSLSLQEFKKNDHKEDVLSYSKTYNKVCERISECKLMLEQSEILFNHDEINNHYQYKIDELKNSINN